ncbi:4'-phosphopantetheinyl transferase family protein [Flavobacterium psychrotrophum]|uniref:4'-phosphopantetheinyl transferase family protein n=1 Tax=Flavobacterium psychrotrophum TaxID=2294119 RepID=UPI000E310840|nr:4'-phosphopantetheinyl transferase superfamily protein [Flavobacterium psychrotrophum]
MPLYKSLTIDNNTQLLVWQNTEPLEELLATVSLKDVCVHKFEKMKSEQHQKGFLGVRKLMQHIGYTDFDLFYDANGKPHLKDGKNISITHSYAFSAIIVSSKQSGIDMEMQREKVVTIAEKFLSKEFAYLDPTHMETYMRMLIVLWGVKEAVYKMVSRKGLSFKQNIEVFKFAMEDGRGEAAYAYEELAARLPFYFMELEGFTLVYCLGY